MAKMKIFEIARSLQAKNKEINYDRIDELMHDAASVGQYHGFKAGMKTMLDIVRNIG